MVLPARISGAKSSPDKFEEPGNPLPLDGCWRKEKEEEERGEERGRMEEESQEAISPGLANDPGIGSACFVRQRQRRSRGSSMRVLFIQSSSEGSSLPKKLEPVYGV
ncbi:hypothetical protein KM043_008443 [Ampulex compressa]|nr:hypothetical protein KM043_008443 [Ampulex compressa]